VSVARSCALSSLLALVACGNSGVGAARAPSAPGARCKVAASQQRPLVTEWPASEKANLEARLREGPVVVAYSGCSLRILTECKPTRGRYSWQRTTVATDSVEITSEDELFVKLPLGAATLEGELRSSGRLSVQTSVAGQMRLDGASITDVPQDGACAYATHVVTGVAVGAFRLKSGGAVAAKGAVGARGIGQVGARTSSEEVVMREAGDPSKCQEATDNSPNANCGAPIQLILEKVPKLGALPESGPKDSVHVSFLSHSRMNGTGFSVFERDRMLCAVPCTRWVRRDAQLELRYYDLRQGREDKRRKIPSLEQFGDQQWVEVQPQPPEINVGFPLVMLGGMGVFGGGLVFALTSAGLGGDGGPTNNKEQAKESREAVRTKSLYVLGVSGIALAIGIPFVIAGLGYPIAKEATPETGLVVRPGPGYVRVESARSFAMTLTPLGAGGTF
jgi:hypothetical protein